MQQRKEIQKEQLIIDNAIQESVRSFRGNKLLKKAGEAVEITPERVEIFKKCMDDPIYFAESFIKVVHVDQGLIPIKLYEYQKRLINSMKDNRYSIILSCRQSGKCCSSNTIITVKNKNYNNWKPFSIEIGLFYTWAHTKHNSVPNLETNGKFIDDIRIEGWEIETDTGFYPVSHVLKTVKYEKFILKTENYTLECADEHKVFDANYTEIFVKNIKPGDKIITRTGIESVISVTNTHEKEHMYDVTVEHANHRYYTNGILSHNTVSAVCFLLWYILFNADKRCAVLANKGAAARNVISRIQIAYMHLPKWIQQGVEEWNKGSFSLENGSSITSAACSSDSIRGDSYSCVFQDEAAFIPTNVWEDFKRSTLPTISSGKESKMIVVSTFNGQNHFFDMWNDALAGRSNYVPIRVDWWEVPGRDEAWKEEMLRDMSQEDFDQEFGNEPLGSGLTLFNSRCFELLAESEMKPIQSTIETKIYEEPIPGHNYVVSVDPADVGIDYSAIHVIDVTQFPYRQVAVYKNNKVNHLQLPYVITNLGYKYNEAEVLVESNDVGKVILHILNYDMEYPNIISTKIGSKTQLGIRTTTKTKTIGCQRLKDMVEAGKLIIRDKSTIDESKHFIINGVSYAAEEPYHDDLMMAMVIFAFYANTAQFTLSYDHSFNDEMREDYSKEIYEELCPLPIFADNGVIDIFEAQDLKFLQE